MTAAAHLWAIGYDNIERGAAEVRDEVNGLGAEHRLIVLDAAVVVRYADGTVTLNAEPFYVASDVREGRLASLLAGVALAAPLLTSVAVTTVLKSSTSIAADVGITNDFICEIELLMEPGTSASFVLDQAGDMDANFARNSRSWRNHPQDLRRSNTREADSGSHSRPPAATQD